MFLKFDSVDRTQFRKKLRTYQTLEDAESKVETMESPMQISNKGSVDYIQMAKTHQSKKSDNIKFKKPQVQSEQLLQAKKSKKRNTLNQHLQFNLSLVDQNYNKLNNEASQVEIPKFKSIQAFKYTQQDSQYNDENFLTADIKYQGQSNQ